MVRSTCLVDLINTLGPKIVAAAFGMTAESVMIYLADHVDSGRLQWPMSWDEAGWGQRSRAASSARAASSSAGSAGERWRIGLPHVPSKIISIRWSTSSS